MIIIPVALRSKVIAKLIMAAASVSRAGKEAIVKPLSSTATMKPIHPLPVEMETAILKATVNVPQV